MPVRGGEMRKHGAAGGRRPDLLPVRPAFVQRHGTDCSGGRAACKLNRACLLRAREIEHNVALETHEAMQLALEDAFLIAVGAETLPGVF